MKLTVEQRLNRCIEYIRKIEKMDLPKIHPDDIVSVRKLCCNECCSDDVSYTLEADDIDIVDPYALKSLQDEAWHVLAEIMD